MQGFRPGAEPHLGSSPSFSVRQVISILLSPHVWKTRWSDGSHVPQ